MKRFTILCVLISAMYAAGAMEAVSRTQLAAEHGDVAAQFRYAEMLRDRRGVKKNVPEAVAWTRKAADAGHAAAQCQMGLFYMNGLGVDRDEDKAVEWLKKAAAQNHLQAQYNLGIYYARFSDGESVRLAIKWLNEAAKQDYADAQFNLAKLYLNPHHPASHEHDAGRRAISLLRLAAAQGHLGAKAMLEELGCNGPHSQANLENLRQRETATFINNTL
ncbi:MAG: sel1 repeat family protein [Kiritimatiellae bacterium]|nr:sel1 repeat family protein [Kiritimatiellia bacterium]